MHTLLVAAVILSLLDHFVGVLSALVLKRLWEWGKGISELLSLWKRGGLGPTIPHM